MNFISYKCPWFIFWFLYVVVMDVSVILVENWHRFWSKPTMTFAVDNKILRSFLLAVTTPMTTFYSTSNPCRGLLSQTFLPLQAYYAHSLEFGPYQHLSYSAQTARFCLILALIFWSIVETSFLGQIIRTRFYRNQSYSLDLHCVPYLDLFCILYWWLLDHSDKIRAKLRFKR